MSDLEGLFADERAWRAAVDADDPRGLHGLVLARARGRHRAAAIDHSHPPPATSLASSTSRRVICTGRRGRDLPRPRGGEGGLLLFDGSDVEFLEITPDRIGYIPPGWAHRSVNLGSEEYSFLAVYPGGAGHDYGWVLEHGFGARVYAAAAGAELRSYREPALSLG